MLLGTRDRRELIRGVANLRGLDRSVDRSPRSEIDRRIHQAESQLHLVQSLPLQRVHLLRELDYLDVLLQLLLELMIGELRVLRIVIVHRGIPVGA